MAVCVQQRKGRKASRVRGQVREGVMSSSLCSKLGRNRRTRSEWGDGPEAHGGRRRLKFSCEGQMQWESEMEEPLVKRRPVVLAWGVSGYR